MIWSPAFAGRRLIMERILHIVESNTAILSGIGDLGKAFLDAQNFVEPQSGLFYIEALIDPATGQILEVLRKDPLRSYEKPFRQRSGELSVVAAPLSKRFPKAELVTFVVDAQSGRPTSVSFRGELALDVIAGLHAAIADSNSRKFRLAA